MTTDTNPRPHWPNWDETDAASAAEMMAAYDRVTGPRIGDFVILPGEQVRRIAHIYTYCDPHAFQPTLVDGGGSFHLMPGYVNHSGGLGAVLTAGALADTGETREGWVWVWNRGRSGADRARTGRQRFRVFRYDAEVAARLIDPEAV